tara:strand:- start:368 stop:700 length:333 start_codon:yes stop_codon:yes gene_type:complete
MSQNEQENTSEQMLIDMSAQMKEIVDRKDREIEQVIRQKLNNQLELMSWYGLITALDTLICNSGGCETEIQTVSEILMNKSEEWVRMCLGGQPYFGIELNVEVIENNNNE